MDRAQELLERYARLHRIPPQEYWRRLAQQSGQPFEWPPSRTQMVAQIEWRKKHDPAFLRAYSNKSDRRHEEAIQLWEAAHYLAYDHPADEAGKAAPIDTSVFKPAACIDTMYDIFRKLAPEQAAAHLAHCREQPEFAAYYDKSHPQHALYRDQVAQLEERARGVALENSAYYLPAKAALPILEKLRALGITELDYAALDAGITRAYELTTAQSDAVAIEPGTAPGSTASQQAQPERAGARDRAAIEADIRALEATPDYRSPIRSVRQTAVERMSGYYRELNPDPAPISGPGRGNSGVDPSALNVIGTGPSTPASSPPAQGS